MKALDVTKLLPVAGVRLGTSCAGFKQAGRRDLVVVELSPATETAAVFTKNAFCAAPVHIARQHMANTRPRYLLINTGNANAGTGAQGEQDALQCCRLLAEVTKTNVNEVLPFSTGVIGEPLQLEKFRAAVPDAVSRLDDMGWEDAAHGILTTDLVPKGYTKQIELQGRNITVTGIAKGSGMIRPNMATMLAYVATDAGLAQPLLQQCLQHAVDHSFNRITVDGDTSTNDACLLMATGQSGVRLEDEGSEDYQQFAHAVTEVCATLARAIVRDGEGATKFITIEVSQGCDEEECLQVAYTIAHSPLVKTAFFASDPNWGRILAAVGRAGLPDLDIDAIKIYLNDVCIVSQGGRDRAYTEQQGQAVMDQTDISIHVVLDRGKASAQVWTCDFSYDYVKINADYRT